MNIFIILFLIVTSSASPAVKLNVASDPKDVKCTTSPIKAVSARVNPQWTNRFIYPVEVCASFTGALKVCTQSWWDWIAGKPKPPPPSTELVLSIHHGKDQPIEIISGFTPPKGGSLYCAVFSECQILKLLKEKKFKMDNVRLSAQAWILSYESPLKLTSSIRGTGIYVADQKNITV